VRERTSNRQSRLLASPNRFKLATFGFNGQGGATITSAPGTADTNWDQQLRIARLSEAATIEALLPGARWLGYGGKTNFQGRTYETLTWAAGIAAATRTSQVFATVHMATIHPVRVAKSIATVDHISGGRFGVNWVAGWHPDEANMFGATQREHDERYRFGDEFIGLVDRLLDEDGAFDFDGEWFQLKGAYSEPKPIQAPRPVYIAAGLSPRGRQFAAEHADVSFMALTDLAENREVVADAKRRAADVGRELLVFSQYPIVCADSEAEARDYLHWYVDELGDFEAAANLMRLLFGETRDQDGKVRQMPEPVREAMLRNFVAGHGGSLLVGTPQQIVEEMVRRAEAGLDGATLTWLNYEEGLVQFREKILPLMIQAGLRQESPEADSARCLSRVGPPSGQAN
jgi:alkanesulfonate monooxygenase SsuD/methylene tetrahydromethanopterin reductase-like flavin-dependent oxidoreductase (luciferase family)